MAIDTKTPVYEVELVVQGGEKDIKIDCPVCTNFVACKVVVKNPEVTCGECGSTIQLVFE